MIRIVCLLVILILTGCQSKTEYGDCIGIADDKKTELNYEVSIRNAVIGVVFIESIIPPIVVLAKETMCPVGKK